MKKHFLVIFILLMLIGCGGTNKLQVEGVITKHHDDREEYFLVKDKESKKVYRFTKESEAQLNGKVGHSIKMKAKILDTNSTDEYVATVASCTKCHHSVKIYEKSDFK
jgi:hypothetical protein